MTDRGIWADPSLVRGGDRMRFLGRSTEQIADMPGHESEVVTLKEIRVEPDGSKVLVVERYDPSEV